MMKIDRYNGDSTLFGPFFCLALGNPTERYDRDLLRRGCSLVGEKRKPLPCHASYRWLDNACGLVETTAIQAGGPQQRKDSVGNLRQ
jgi:hypothetical protein